MAQHEMVERVVYQDGLAHRVVSASDFAAAIDADPRTVRQALRTSHWITTVDDGSRYAWLDAQEAKEVADLYKDDELLSGEEAAQRLGVTRRQFFYHYRNTGTPTPAEAGDHPYEADMWWASEVDRERSS